VYKRLAASLTIALDLSSSSRAAPVPFVRRLSHKIGARSPLENTPSNCHTRNATIIGIKGASVGHCDRSRARKSVGPKCGLAGSSHFLSRVGRAWSISYKCEIYLRSGSRDHSHGAPDSPLYGPGTVSGSIIVRAAREWMFWVFVNAPSDTFECCSPDSPRIFLLDSFLFSHPLLIELLCHCFFHPCSRSSAPFSFSQLDRLATSSRECETIVHYSRLERAGHLGWVNILPPFSPAHGIAFSKG